MMKFLNCCIVALLLVSMMICGYVCLDDESQSDQLSNEDSSLDSSELTTADSERSSSAIEKPNITPRRLVNTVSMNGPDSMEQPVSLMNWTVLHQRICSLTEQDTKTKSQLLEDCNKINEFYQIEQLFKPCRLAKITSNITNYLDYARTECKFEKCHQKVTNSGEYAKIMAEIERMSNEERIEKTMQRYKCISTVLGIGTKN